MTLTRDRVRPEASRLTAGLILAMALALYASLVPFNFVAVPLREIYWHLLGLMRAPLYIWSRADFVANVLMVVPVGFFTMGLLSHRREDFHSGKMHTGPFGIAVRLVLTLAAGMAFAVGLELLQVFVPGRHVAKSDVVAQTAGTLFGGLIWVGVGSALLMVWPGRLKRARTEAGPYTRAYILLGLYTALWVLAMTLPLDLMASPREIWRKYQDGYITLVPFTAAGGVTTAVVIGWTLTGVSSIPVGAFSLHALRRRGWTRGFWLAGLGATLFVAAVEFVQILVAQRTADATDILVGAAGAVAGSWVAGRGALGDLAGDDASGFTTLTDSRKGFPVWAAAATLVWCLALALYHWRPFAFSFDPVLVRERMDQVSLLPLSQYGAISGVDVLAQALTKTGLGYPLGILMAALLWARRPSTRQGVRLRLAAGSLAIAGLFGVLELGQLFLPARVPDVTDILLGSAGAMAGLMMAMPPLKAPGRHARHGSEDGAVHRA